ncbi:MAG: hypothetical protein J4469_04030 [Candidatus Aenigmarchaeota archaeon]|nr:hypothetical protein [Candidatus Aenigmarchaeota archaeon]
MQARTEVEKSGERNFRIVAYLDGKPAGQYLIGIDQHYDPLLGGFSADATLSSDVPYNGVARALIERCAEVIRSTSRALQADIIHNAVFINPEAMEKLPHLYEEHGYRLDRNGWKATKIYRPE